MLDTDTKRRIDTARDELLDGMDERGRATPLPQFCESCPSLLAPRSCAGRRHPLTARTVRATLPPACR